MEDLNTGDPLIPPNFVTIHHLREQWLERQRQQKPKQLETRPRSPPGKLPPRRTTPPPLSSFPPLAQKDQRKRPEQELRRRETDIERERGKAASSTDESDSRPSPVNCSAVRRNASFNEGSDGRQAIDSDGRKPSEKSSRGEYAGFGGDEKAGSALVKDRRKQPEQELPRGETYTESQRVKASPRNESDSRPSPANCRGARRSTSVKEGSDGRQAIDSDGPKSSERSSRREYAGFGADEEAESASVKDQRKQPEKELMRRETNTKRERVKANSRNESDSRPFPANRLAVQRNASVKEGTDGRQAIDSDGLKPSEKSSRGEYAGFGGEEKAESALVKDQRKQPEQELPRGETYTERQRVKASPRNESDSRPSPANRGGVRRHTGVKEGIDGRQAVDSNGPKPSKKSSRGEYEGFGDDEKAESALVAAVSVVAESAKQVKKTEEREKKKKHRWNKNNRKSKGKGRLDENIVRAKEKGVKLEEGEVNGPAAKVKEEKFQHASSEGQNVMPESNLRVEAKIEEGVVQMSEKEVKKLLQHAGSESKNAMLESKEGRVEVENVAANASHVRAEAEGLNKQVLAINSKLEIEGGPRNLSLQYGSRKGGLQSRRPYREDHKYYGVIEGRKRQGGVREQSSDMVWVRKEDTTDGIARES